MGSPTQDMALNGTQLTQGDALFDSLLLTARQGGPSKRGAVEEPDAHRDPKAARRQQQEGQALLAQHGSFTHQQGEDREGTSAGSDASHLNEPVHDQGHTGAEEPGHDDGATATQQEEAATLTPTLQEGHADMVMRLQAIEAKMQQLMQMGVDELDAIKARFVAEMTRACEELRAMCTFQQESWIELSAATIHESKRLDMARTLVGQLSNAAALIGATVPQ